MTTETEEKKSGRRATAEAMASRQRDISVSEFFTKNRHLLGFDNPQKALLTSVKEAVDNSLDACEEAGIVPTIKVAIEEVSEGRFKVSVEDNGPGIVKAQIPKIFAKLLYGSKFHRLKQSRGQQGIGISAAGMYGQLTTGRPIIITSKTGKGRPAHRMEVRIDARTNAPDVLKEDIDDSWESEHGTRVTIEMSGLYRAGRASVQAYLEQTVVANPHLELTFTPPKGESLHFPRASEQLPPETQEIKPHPYGVELGMLIKSFQEAGERTVREVLMEDYSRVTKQVADDLCKKSQIDPTTRAARLDGPHIEDIHRVIQISQATLPQTARLFKAFTKRDDRFTNAIQELGKNFTPALVDTLAKKAHIEPTASVKKVEISQLERFENALHALQVRILPPPATCVAPIGEELMVEGLKRRFKAEFFVSHTRPPSVYRGNPFIVEVGCAFGGELPGDQSAEILRFANRVPLLYQPRACATTEAVTRVNWKSYGRDGVFNQRGAELPVGPLAVLVHLASVWVPFTNEAKEAIASYDEIVEEIRLALMECGRKLGAYVNAQQAEKWQRERKSLFEKYIEEIASAIADITKVQSEKVKVAFLEALPNFVKLDAPASVPPPEEGGASGAPSMAPPPGSEPPPPMDEATKGGRAKTSAASPAASMPKQPALPGFPNEPKHPTVTSAKSRPMPVAEKKAKAKPEKAVPAKSTTKLAAKPAKSVKTVAAPAPKAKAPAVKAKAVAKPAAKAAVKSVKAAKPEPKAKPAAKSKAKPAAKVVAKSKPKVAAKPVAKKKKR